jgi:hypothetical protein
MAVGMGRANIRQMVDEVQETSNFSTLDNTNMNWYWEEMDGGRGGGGGGSQRRGRKKRKT